MSLLVVGLSHRSAPIPVLERAAVPAADTGKLLYELFEGEHITEVLLLSTCNRVEVYAVVQSFHGALADITDVLTRHSAMALDQLSGHLYVRYAAAVVEHLFLVAAGLDSMVLGEAQILGQLRTAYSDAVQAGTIGHTLHHLAQQALRVGKRVRAQTAIDTSGASVVGEALTAAAAALSCADHPSLGGRRTLVIGAGAMGSFAVAQLRQAGVAEIVIANRTLQAAQELATRCNTHGTPARAMGLDGVRHVLDTVDLVVCCTNAVDTVLNAQQITHAQHRRHTPLVVCDVGLPRNVEPAVGELSGVTLLDLTTLAHRKQQHTPASDALSTAQRLVSTELDNYLAAQRLAHIIPTVTALRKQATEMIDTELLRLDRRLPGLDTTLRNELARTLQRVVDKLLHTPTVRIKQLAQTGDDAVYTDALRELFDLKPHTSTALTTTLRTTSPATP